MKLPVKEIHKTDVVGIVCHDAGGAEVVSEWLLQSGVPFYACLAGPAVNIFQRKFEEYNNTTLEILLSQCDWILCGSSWQSDLEKVAVKRSLELGIFVAVCLDHWVNYEDRFTTDDLITLPSEIWVADRYALKLGAELFPATPIRLIDDPYLRKIRSDLDAFHMDKITIDIDILYVCEPIREHAKIKYGDENYLGYTEESALKFFFENVHLLSCQLSNIMVRPHPSDPANKYSWVSRYSSASLEVKFGGDQSLISEILRSRIVVGCESMAMVVALVAGKNVYSSIPNEGRDCVLPHEGITRMSAILDGNA